MSVQRDRFERKDVERTLSVLFHPGQVVELRALEVAEGSRTRTHSGYFDAMDELANAAARLSGRAKGVYVTLNDLDVALLSRRANRAVAIGDKEPTTSDRNVRRRRWFPIDIDPDRVAGVSSDNTEHDAAIARAREIRAALAEVGWPQPILADSGNGGHLLYRIDLPAEDGGLVKSCLEALSERFGDDLLKVDRSVYNPARIWKLYGTLAAKGDDTRERPHRVARLLEAPAALVPVPEALLRSLAEPIERLSRMKHSKESRGNKGSNRFDLEGWIALHGLDVTGPKDWNGGQIWEFKVCPWNAEHINGSAFIGRLAEGGITAGCHHDGCSGNDWTALRLLLDGADAADAPGGNQSSRGSSQATQLLSLVEASGAELWHTYAGDQYLSVNVDGHRENFSLKSKKADNWLRLVYYRANRSAPGSQGINDALNVLRSKALFDGPSYETFVRVGYLGDDIYIDLGGSDWSAVRIDAGGWEVVRDCPIRFRRSKGMLPLPEPRRCGQLSDLRPFLNLENDDDFRLVLSLLVGMVWPQGPYPVLVLQGEQGSAKSTTGTVIGRLIDPGRPALRSQPKNDQDLMISASNRWALAFDNLSDIPAWLSDALCRISTGGGYSTRELYTDDEEAIFDVERPVILTGIDELVTRSDLLDRAVLLLLPHIDDRSRRTEEEFWRDFESAWPWLLGALFDAVAEAKRKLPSLVLPHLPRLADFARRAAAAATALGWTPERFLDAYEQNRRVGHVTAIEASAVAKALTQLMQGQDVWTGTASELLAELNNHPGKRPSSWPKSPLSLSNAIRRVAPNLREVGITLDFERGTDRNRTRAITVRRVSPEEGCASSEASEASRSHAEPSDAHEDGENGASERASAPFGFDLDDADDADAFGAVPSAMASRTQRFVTCPGCGHRPAPEGDLCFRCAVLGPEPLL